MEIMRKALVCGIGLIIAVFVAVAARDSTMKAIVVHEAGGPEMMKYEDAPRPEPKDDEVLIRVMAAGVNPVDAYIRAGRFHRGASNFPFVPGMDVAGVVEKAGPKIDKFKTGDAVYAYLSFAEQGGYAEFAIAKQDEMALKPRSISFEEAAAVPLAGTTAWQALVDAAKIDKDQTVLIHGGSGGVGHLAIQIAKARGAKVIATASTPNQSFMAELGADQTIDYTTTKFEDVVKDVDVVLNAARGDTLGRSYGVVKKGGIIVSITEPPDQAECEKRGIRGVSVGAHPDAKVLEELGRLIDEKKVKPAVSQVLPLKEAAVAHAQIETRHTRGKIVLTVADAPK
jgi:NADPH:quinone reductase-like Zn-dependent oxidoreductase